MLAKAKQNDSGSLMFGFARSTDLAAYMTRVNTSGHMIHRLYHEVSGISIAGVLDAIQTTLTELIAEMRDGPLNAAGVPSAGSVAKAVNVVVHAKGCR